MSEIIVHICLCEDWKKAKGVGEYSPLSLEIQGFVHASRLEQVLQVANRFYSGRTDLCLLWIDQEQLTSSVKWEEADGEIFPHIYGAINLDAVIGIVPFQPDLDGIYRLIPEKK
ncbi:MAG TPA: DUF952 domain-containing protein [Anaerolineae bacterium]|nr:DUF952 domain-containing protein [Anaerolineae bacterium]